MEGPLLCTVRVQLALHYYPVRDQKGGGKGTVFGTLPQHSPTSIARSSALRTLDTATSLTFLQPQHFITPFLITPPPKGRSPAIKLGHCHSLIGFA